MSLLDDAFELLEAATRLQNEGLQNRIEAATKYFEAVYLMRQYLQHSPQIPSESQTRELLQDKIQHFSTIASELLADDSSTMQSITSNPRSPIANECTFFNEASSVVPMSVPPASPLSASAASPRFTQPTNLNQRAGQANSSLAKALDLDEAGHTKQAIESYMKAAELYLEAIKMSEEQPGDSSIGIIPVLKRRLGGALDRIEQIKTSSKDNTRATATIINSEKPKQAQQSQRQSLHYTKEEIDVLKRSSMLTTGVFLPWSDAEAEDLSRRVRTIGNQGTILFTDSERIKLNDKQRKKFFKWARPAHILAQRQVSSQSPVLIRTITPYSIRQKCVTDCSFIASLCICADFERRFRKRLITSIIYPQDKNGIPCYNPEGKYMVKLWLNGVPRQVIVDDFLPIDRHGNLLCSHTTGNRLELWVPIIEKAYMKLCGGYDFPGSNSGVDMFSLTGWIPERIFFAQDSSKIKDYETSPERAWERLFSANSFGDCLITVSTTKDLAEDRAEELGLVTGHAYSVLDVIQTRGGIRLLQLKNPWAHKGWKGRYSCYDRSTWHSALRKEVGYDPELAAKCDDGVFWIEWRDVLLYFRNLQLSWNPDLFSHTYRTHSFWPRQQGPDDDTFNIGENPQFIVHLSREALLKRATLWILISRHVTKQEQEGVEAADFLTVHIFKNSARKSKRWFPNGDGLLVSGAYSNNPHVLVRYDSMDSPEEFLSLVLSQYKKSNDIAYTLSCFCTEKFSLEKPEEDLPVVKNLRGQWTSDNAGGPVGQNGFFQNPMYLIKIPVETTIRIQCSTVKTYSVNAMLISINKHRKEDYSSYRQVVKMRGRPILDSGVYRFGFTTTNQEQVPAGEYVLVLSTFRCGQVGTFSASVNSSIKLEISVVPS